MNAMMLETELDIDDIGPDFENTCEDCGRSFETLKGLRRHRTSAHGATPVSDTAPKGRKRTPKLAAQLEQTVSVIGGLVAMANQFDGHVITSTAPQFALAWANLAERNPAVKRFLESATSGGAYGEVVLASAIMIMPILANHGVLPEQIAGMFLAMYNNGN